MAMPRIIVDEKGLISNIELTWCALKDLDMVFKHQQIARASTQESYNVW